MSNREGTPRQPGHEAAYATVIDLTTRLNSADTEDTPQDPSATVGSVDPDDQEELTGDQFLGQAFEKLREDPPTTIDGLNELRAQSANYIFTRRIRRGNGQGGVSIIYTDRQGNRLDGTKVHRFEQLTNPDSWWMSARKLDDYVVVASARSLDDLSPVSREILKEWRTGGAAQSQNPPRHGTQPAQPRPGETKKQFRKRERAEMIARHAQDGAGATEAQREIDLAAFDRAKKMIPALVGISTELRELRGYKLPADKVRKYERILLADTPFSVLTEDDRKKYAADLGFTLSDKEKERNPYYVLSANERHEAFAKGSTQRVFEEYKGGIIQELTRHREYKRFEAAVVKIRQARAQHRRQERRQEAQAPASAPLDPRLQRMVDEAVRRAVQDPGP